MKNDFKISIDDNEIKIFDKKGRSFLSITPNNIRKFKYFGKRHIRAKDSDGNTIIYKKDKRGNLIYSKNVNKKSEAWMEYNKDNELIKCTKHYKEEDKWEEILYSYTNKYDIIEWVRPEKIKLVLNKKGQLLYFKKDKYEEWYAYNRFDRVSAFRNSEGLIGTAEYNSKGKLYRIGIGRKI